MIRLASLVISLLVFWLLLSGHYTVWLIGAGIVVAAVAAIGGLRAGYADDEGHPAELILPGLLYWPWLAKEILLSALNVSRIIVSPSLPISPHMIGVRSSQKSAVGTVTYANSITLTPGTITVDIDRHDRRFVVHALTDETAEGVREGEMDRRVTSFEGDR